MATINGKRKEDWLKKPQHGYLNKKIKENENIDHTTSNIWIKEGKFSSHVEGLNDGKEERCQCNIAHELSAIQRNRRINLPYYKLMFIPQ